jgi:G-patch domain
MSEEDDDDEYDLPLQDQQVFGAGIRRKRVPFVYAGSEPALVGPTLSKPGLSDRYLSIVLPEPAENTDGHEEQSERAQNDGCPPDKVACAVCKLPITPDTSMAVAKSHESSLAHQVCLSHSHPPSHLDRDHVGLRYLSSCGWDPDGRRGLGPSGAGIRVPIKSKIKNDTVGLGVKDVGGVGVQRQAKEKMRLNAEQVRKQEAAVKKREMQLKDAFYGKDLEAYLGLRG